MKLLFNATGDALCECYMRYKDILEKSDKYDCMVSKPNCTEEVLNTYKRILLFERLDGGAIWCRKLLKHPNVKNVLKMYHYPDLAVNNAPICAGRIFLQDIADYDIPKKPQTPELTQADIDKITVGFNFFHYKAMEPCMEVARTATIKPIKDRTIDLFFAGTTEYNPSSVEGAIVTKHRKQCLETIRELGKQGLNIEVHNGRTMQRDEYYSKMLDTKVILSPFGWGEFCYRDYEALLLGCRVFKQDFRAISQIPDIESDIGLMIKLSNFNKNLFEYDINSPSPIDNAKERLLDAKNNEKDIILKILS